MVHQHIVRQWKTPRRSIPQLASRGASTLSSSSSAGGGGDELPPSRFTRAINQMKETCPDVMQTYAECVLTAQKDEQTAELHRACEAEFAAVKDCFRRVRGQF